MVYGKFGDEKATAMADKYSSLWEVPHARKGNNGPVGAAQTVRLTHALRSTHSVLANLAYGICKTQGIEPASIITASVDDEFLEQFEASTDKVKDMGSYARLTESVIEQTNALLNWIDGAPDAEPSFPNKFVPKDAKPLHGLMAPAAVKE